MEATEVEQGGALEELCLFRGGPTELEASLISPRFLMVKAMSIGLGNSRC
jgi:hypothetical protein